MTFTYELPLPVSKPNNYRFNKKGSFYKTSTVKDNEKEIIKVIEMNKPDALLLGPLNLTVHLYYDDNRRRDIDNPLKCLFDCCNGIIWKDDSQIIILTVYKHLKSDCRKCILTVENA